MGVDFIQKTKRNFRKGFDREHQKLTLADLGFRGTPKKIRTILCVPFGLENFSDGGRYELCLEEDRVFLYQNRKLVGVCKEPPQSIINEITAVGGKALGAFCKLREHSELVEIIVCLDAEAKEGQAA